MIFNGIKNIGGSIKQQRTKDVGHIIWNDENMCGSELYSSSNCSEDDVDFLCL